MIWKWCLRVVLCLKNFLYFDYVVVVIVCNLLCVSVGLSRFVVLVLLVVLFVLINVCVLLMKSRIGLGEDWILLMMFFRCCLNFFFILVLVCSSFKLSVRMCMLWIMFGMFVLVMCSVRFLMSVVLLMFGLLMRIGLFLCWCVSMLIICWILWLWLNIGLIVLCWVLLVRLIVKWDRVLLFVVCWGVSGVVEMGVVDFSVWLVVGLIGWLFVLVLIFFGCVCLYEWWVRCGRMCWICVLLMDNRGYVFCVCSIWGWLMIVCSRLLDWMVVLLVLDVVCIYVFCSSVVSCGDRVGLFWRLCGRCLIDVSSVF